MESLPLEKEDVKDIFDTYHKIMVTMGRLADKYQTGREADFAKASISAQCALFANLYGQKAPLQLIQVAFYVTMTNAGENIIIDNFPGKDKSK